MKHVREYVRAHLPGLDHGGPAILEKCMYTCTTDSQPIMDRRYFVDIKTDVLRDTAMIKFHYHCT